MHWICTYLSLMAPILFWIKANTFPFFKEGNMVHTGTHCATIAITRSLSSMHTTHNLSSSTNLFHNKQPKYLLSHKHKQQDPKIDSNKLGLSWAKLSQSWVGDVNKLNSWGLNLKLGYMIDGLSSHLNQVWLRLANWLI